ncbi:MAG TPA: hypothetical protein VGF36_06395, partial [Rhodopila sp.]
MELHFANMRTCIALNRTGTGREFWLDTLSHAIAGTPGSSSEVVLMVHTQAYLNQVDAEKLQMK